MVCSANKLFDNLVLVGTYGTIRIVIFGNRKISLVTFLNSATQLFYNILVMVKTIVSLGVICL